MVSALLCGLMVLAQPDPVSWDFEDGTLQGWQVVSGDLGPQPTDAKDDRWGGSFGKQGTYFLGTGELPGGGFSDALTGELRSPHFALGHDALCLLVGGGNHPGECFVALVDAASGEELARATGRNAEQMLPVIWQTGQWKGRRVHLRVVDTHKQGWGHINVDQVRELTPADLEEMRRAEARERAERVRKLALWQQDLWSRAEVTYSGERLTHVALPLGGIGTGSIYLRGTGDLTGWQIFNHVNLAAELPHSFFALWARPDGGEPVTRVLQADMVGTWPGVRQASFTSAYPLALLDLRDPDLPVTVRIEAFSPMEPLNARASAMPTVVFALQVANISARPVDVALLASLTNAVGWDGYSEISGPENEHFGGNTNELTGIGGDAWAVVMRNQSLKPDDPGFGTMALAALGSSQGPPDCKAQWTDLNLLRRDFAADGRLAPSTGDGPTPAGRTASAAVSTPLRLEPGELREALYALCWHFPNRLRDWPGGDNTVRLGNRYNNWYGDAEAVARELAEDFPTLRATTELFATALYSSDLPGWLSEALGVHIATIRSPLIMWLEDGTVGGFEGLNADVGCCPLNCTHVYNYAQTMAYVWPELERTVREIDLSVQQKPDGGVRHRLQLPLDAPRWTDPFTDGHLSTILKAYREVRNCPDLTWLRQWWPNLRKAMDFVLEQWDADGNGVIEGPQPNTYDCTDYGPNTFIGTLYLAALRAAEEMADRVGDIAAASRYRERFEVGRVELDRLCWRDDLGYYVQVYDPEEHREKQWGLGCLSDQLLGEWWAHLLDLGCLLPEEHVRDALRSIFRHNFKVDYLMAPYSHAPAGRDMGLLNCTWPRAGRPADPINYADGAWTGVEYQVAAHMVWEGLVVQGLTIAKGARERYDGERRNPFDEPECGHHYARPLSSWSLLQALTGVQVDGPAGMLSLRRLPPAPSRWLLIGPEGWGTLAVDRDAQATRVELRIECLGGRMSWRSLRLGLRGTDGAGLSEACGLGPEGQDLPAHCEATPGTIRANFEQPAIVQAGGTMRLLIHGPGQPPATPGAKQPDTGQALRPRRGR